MRKLLNTITCAGILLAMLAMFCLVMRALAPLWPINTAVFAIVGTFLACGRKMTAFMSLTGLFLYAAGWPIANMYGALAGSALCSAGFFLWFAGLVKSFSPPMGWITTN